MRSVRVAPPRCVWAAVAALTLAACRTATPTLEPRAPVDDPATVAARAALANERSLDVRSIAERAIAVPALTVNSSDTTLSPLGFGLADMLVTDLARSSQVIVVERVRMNALLREMQLVEAGMVDTAGAPRVGRLLGARRLVVGTLIDRGGGEIGMETRLVNAVDGTVGGAVSARAPLASIFDAEKALAYRIFDELGITLTAAERNAIEQRPTANINAFLAYSRGVRDEAFGRYASATTHFQAAARADPSFAPAKARLDNLQATQPIAQTAAVAADAPAAGAAAPAEAPKPAAPSNPSGGGAGGIVTGAASVAAGSINPSPAGAIGTSTGGGSTTSSTQQQQQQQDRGAQAQRQPVIATVIITIKQLP